MRKLSEFGMVGNSEEVQRIRSQAKSTGTIAIFSQLFPEFLRKFGEVKDTDVPEFKKNAVAVRMRELGNKHFSQVGNEAMKKALVCYTTSIANAAPGSLELALAFANRSALLLKVKNIFYSFGIELIFE